MKPLLRPCWRPRLALQHSQLWPQTMALVLLCGCIASSTAVVTTASATARDRNISAKVDVDVHNSSNAHALVQFVDAEVQRTYKSVDSFDARGMGHLYTITNLFLDLIQPKSFPADIFANSSDDITVILLEKKEELLRYYVGLVAVALVGLFLSVALPVAGLIFCLCRCAGRCGAHTEPYEKRYDSCKRFVLGVIVSTFVIVVLFGIVCGFVTNEYVEQGVNKLPNNLNNSLDDVSLYLKNTKSEINTLFIRNFVQLQDALDGLLDRSGDIVKTRLAETSKASAIENLTNIVEGLQQVHVDLVSIIRSTRSLQMQIDQLEQGLDGIRIRLQQLLGSCTDTMCDQIRREYSDDVLKVTDRLHRLPDVTATAQRIADFIQKGIEGEVKKGKQSLDRISLLVQEAVNTTTPKIKSKMENVEEELQRHYDSIADMIDKVDLRKGRQAVLYVQRYSEEYGKIRYYAGLGMCCAVLLITNCLVFGLFCGFCGQKPHPYGNDTCNRGSGANFLIAAVYLVFLLSLFLTSLTTVLFVVGGMIERVACDPVQDPKDGEVFQVAETFVPLGYLYPDDRLSHLKMSDVIRKCHQNLSMYDVLKLQSVFNVSEVKNYRERYRIDEYVEELKLQIARNPAVLILTEQARSQLQELADSEFAQIDFESFIDTLKQPVTQVSLNDVQTRLQEVIAHMELSRPTAAGALAQEAGILAYLQKDVVTNITKTMAFIRGTLNSVQLSVLFNKTTFHDMIYELLEQTEQAQRFIQTQGRNEVLSLADEFTKNFTLHLDEYADRVDHQVSHVIGQCGPVSRAFNSSVVSICKNIINPFNGFWASIGWCVVLFIPTIIFAVSLSSLYRKTDPYPGPLVESDSLYDTYRDNIPLANVHKKRGRRRQNETYDNRNGYIPDYMLASGDDAARFRREAYPQHGHGGAIGYSRMDLSPGYAAGDAEFKPTAPAGWTPPDFSSNSNLASPDYERPPPYYFPGPNLSKY